MVGLKARTHKVYLRDATRNVVIRNESNAEKAQIRKGPGTDDGR